MRRLFLIAAVLSTTHASAAGLPAEAPASADVQVLLAKVPADRAARFAQQAAALRAAQAPPADDRWKALRRELLGAWLAPLGFEEIVFAARQPGKDGHWYANISTWSSDPKRHLYSDGGRLVRWNLHTGRSVDLIHVSDGSVRDPCVHYDGRKILFSYRREGCPYYNLYEIDGLGGVPRQITDGPYDDIEPAYLPDGGIVFCSTRASRWVNCFFTRVAVIYRCDADGSRLRQLSSNIEQDNTPWVLPDGRILHQRWEYIDRSQTRFHHLWTMNPDGTAQMVYFGNMHGGTVMLDAKPIPGTHRVVASFSPGHGRPEHAGFPTIVEPGRGPDDPQSVRYLSKEPEYRDPYPLSADCLLVARGAGLYVMDAAGWHTRLYELPAEDRARGFVLQEPRPLRPRPREPIIPSRVGEDRIVGKVLLTDICAGRNMNGVRRGEVKKLLVLEALPKPVNFSGGMEPLTQGGSFTLERILGTVPVEADGSAYAELPALRSLFFVALDENNLSVKRMQSFLTVQPGETLSCVGCHERRVETPGRPTSPQALRRPPSPIEPIAGVPDVIDFPRHIQPILDRYCVGCHGYEKTALGGPRAGGVILCGDHGPWYSHSYSELTRKAQFADGRNGDGNRPPRTIGSSASPLLKKLAGEHYAPPATPHEQTLARLWIESAATYSGTYACLGSGMVALREDDAVRGVLKRRCSPCHAAKALGGPVSMHRDFNLTRPAHSLILLKPLAPSAGGLGMRRKFQPGDTTIPRPYQVFSDTRDPDYQVLLAAIEAAKAELQRIKRFDMPGFRPNEHYLREMKSYGVLPADFGADTPVDPYQTDRAYWRSLWYQPPRPAKTELPSVPHKTDSRAVPPKSGLHETDGKSVLQKPGFGVL